MVAFITHCGLSGIFEAVFEAKPLIMMPVYFDQMSNAAILEDLGVGILLDVKMLSVDKLLEALNNIVKDNKYELIFFFTDVLELLLLVYTFM